VLATPTLLAFAIHISAGTVGLASGTTAAVASKGGRLHRQAGTVFFVSMLLMAVFAIYLALVRPGQIGNLFGGAFTLYLVATAWMTVRRTPGAVGLAEKIALGVALVLCIPFALLGLVAAGVLRPLPGSAAPHGPVLIATCVIAALLALAAAADAKVILAGGVSGAPRIARHLWRMCLGLTIATGSAFTNGLPRLLPGPMHVPPAFFLPLLAPIGLLAFWMIRVRFTGWIDRPAAARG
jgi:hypothetical protein